ncbi:MAG TPA: hypothetical protein VKJ07_20140, partial [Mycobacteriales bacterium]|nr:hypothetical protein [Mycobacteriales bacterium]
MKVTHATHRDTSPPLSGIPPAAPQTTPSDEPPTRNTFMPQHPSSSSPDPVVQASTSPSISTPSNNFLGVGTNFSGPQGNFTVGAAPPDTNSAVGPNHIVEIVNT